MNGISSHVYDYDDTTPKNYSPPELARGLRALRLRQREPGAAAASSWRRSCWASRPSRAWPTPCIPAHYDVGWHITGTSGVFGAAAAIGKLLNLSEQQMVWALGLAATQAAGLREMFGSMAQVVPSRPIGAERLRGGAAGPGGLHGRRARHRRAARIRGGDRRRASISPRSPTGLGVDFDLRANTYKPFPCGIVNHPTIDACIQLHDAHRIPAARYRRGAAARGAAGAGPLQPDRHHQGAAGQVLRLSRRGGRARARQGRHPGVHRRRRERSGGQARARAGAGHGRRGDHRGPGARGRGNS